MKKIGLCSQIALTFFIVAGGPFGLETAVGAIGAGWALILVLAIPLLWALPISLMVAELSSQFPERGGYFVWVEKGLGSFWAFQEGWWTICYSAVDSAIYPILAVTYLGYFFPEILAQGPSFFYLRWGLGVLFVLFAYLLNLRGSRPVSLHLLVGTLLVLLPFVLFCMMGIFHGELPMQSAAYFPKPITPAAIAAGLAIVIWNYTGWDNASTYADEVHESSKTIPKALAWTLLLVAISYALPLMVGYRASVDVAVWKDSSGWPEIASRLVGPWLGIAVAAVAVVSAWGLFNSQLFYIARLPAAMADYGLLPQVFNRTSPKTQVPTVALTVIVIAAALFCGLSLGKLVVVDILCYTLGLSLEFWALIKLRQKDPSAYRPFKIPLGPVGLTLMSIVPMLLAIVIAGSSIMGEEGSLVQLGIVAGVIVCGLILYPIVRRVQLKPAAQ